MPIAMQKSIQQVSKRARHYQGCTNWEWCYVYIYGRRWGI